MEFFLRKPQNINLTLDVLNNYGRVVISPKHLIQAPAVWEKKPFCVFHGYKNL